MVVTNHPHLIQGMETFAGKPIVYSVGNFVFDQMFSNEVRTGTVAAALALLHEFLLSANTGDRAGG